MAQTETIDIALFKKPTKHPFGMLPGIKHGMEHESVLAYMLTQCVKANEWIAVRVEDVYGTLQREGLIRPADNSRYFLTEKAKGLLYGHYGKAVNISQAYSVAAAQETK